MSAPISHFVYLCVALFLDENQSFACMALTTPEGKFYMLCSGQSPLQTVFWTAFFAYCVAHRGKCPLLVADKFRLSAEAVHGAGWTV